MPRAIGHETDLSIQTILELTRKQKNEWPAKLTESPRGFEILAEGFIKDGEKPPNNFLNYFSQNNIKENAIAEIFLWHRPKGGKIFNVGSVAAAWPLHVDKKYGKLILNVLSYFKKS